MLRAIDDDRSFTALNAAFAGAGSWIEVGDGVTVDEPVQLLFLTQGAGGGEAGVTPADDEELDLALRHL